MGVRGMSLYDTQSAAPASNGMGATTAEGPSRFDAWTPDALTADPEEGRFPFLLVGITYIVGMATTAYAFVATGSVLWSAGAMFASGLVVPLLLILTPGVRSFFLRPEDLREPVRVSAELKAWQDDLAQERFEAELQAERLAKADERVGRTG